MKQSINIDEFIKNNSQKGDLVSFKIKPVSINCCCSGCLPEFWNKINNEISPQGPIEHEGSAILNIQNEQIILEQHESGPEIITFLNSITAVCNFIKLLFSMSIDAFTKKGATKIKFIKRTITTKQKLVDESILEIDLNQIKNGKELDKTLNKFLNKIIK
ncbi:MAG: hypothetical protein NTW93_04225 [Phycisphaerae bacterium]|nr:hypothetical protein [Phycisphaerae bacterium]